VHVEGSIRMKAEFNVDSSGSCTPLEAPPAMGRRGRKKKRGVSSRSCRLCGKDPHPNYFYCPVCHHRVSASGSEEFGDFKEPG
jgi:hypothetical protein